MIKLEKRQEYVNGGVLPPTYAIKIGGLYNTFGTCRRLPVEILIEELELKQLYQLLKKELEK